VAQRARALSTASGPATRDSLTQKLAALDVAGPVIVVAIVFAVFVGVRLSDYGGNATGFIEFGRQFVAQTHPPHGALINSPAGYDGQFFWIQATDPLLLHHSTLVQLRSEAFRSQRMAYPLLAYVLAAGQEPAIPWTMLAINLIVVLAITGTFAAYARDRGWSGWWALAVGLTPGFLLATMRDLSDPLAAASMLAGLLAWRRERRWLAGALLTVAVLAREPMVLAVVAVAIDAAFGWWRSRSEPHNLRRTVMRVWPVLLIPTLAFVGWQIYIDARFGTNVLSSSPGVRPPLKNIVDELRRSFRQDSPLAVLWDVSYLALALAGLIAAITLVIRRVSSVTTAAFLFGLIFILLLLGDEWGDSRFGAPLFVTLLLAGLEMRARYAVRICVLAAALTALIPLALGGG
jgi:hypothetical protein